MVHLITGHAGSAHVKAADEAKINQAVYGKGSGAFNYGNNLAITIPNSNQVKIADGLFYMQGRWIDVASTETLTLESGTAGTNRNDLVVIRYSASSTGVETALLAIKKGTAGANPADPALTTGSIDGGDLVHEVALYRIPITGINVGAPVKLFETLDPVDWSKLKQVFTLNDTTLTIDLDALGGNDD